jgi:rSAM/selenodomain-associated transferase 2/rSAM/selenodomain-associated transferase 1
MMYKILQFSLTSNASVGIYMRYSQSNVRDRIIIFGRYPVPGKVKTRLIPALGPVGAAELQRQLTEKALETVRRFAASHGAEVEISFADGSGQQMRRWLGSGVIFSKQGPGDLGERMHSAFANAFQRGYRRVVLVGTDIPALTSDHLAQAFRALEKHDIVFGPSTDGGYWLIGSRQPADVFRNVAWGTARVLEETLALAKSQGLKIDQLQPLTDIDTEADLTQEMPDWAAPGTYLSVIIPALNEEASIEATLHRACDQDAEIIVADGGSSDQTMAKAIRAGARVVATSAGRGRQQNRGAAAAKGDVLLFLHADTLLPVGYVRHIFETLMDGRTVAGAFRFKTDLNHPLMKVVEAMTNMRSLCLRMPYGDQALFVRRTVFESLGGFAETLIGEDFFFVRRIVKQGRIGIAPAFAVTSGRRWRKLGILRTTLINQVMVAGFCMGISPRALSALYRKRKDGGRTRRQSGG